MVSVQLLGSGFSLRRCPGAPSTAGSSWPPPGALAGLPGSTPAQGAPFGSLVMKIFRPLSP